MPKLNRWTMRARVRRMERERPDIGRAIIEGLYQDYYEAQDHEPTLNEFRDHVDEVTSTVEWRDLHEYYSPHEPTEEEKLALLDGFGRGISAIEPMRVVSARRPPGRPGWTAGLFWARYQEAVARSAPPHTYRVIAPLFVALDGTEGTSPEYLRKLVRRFGLPPT
jgi:hypothetical protein